MYSMQVVVAGGRGVYLPHTYLLYMLVNGVCVCVCEVESFNSILISGLGCERAR